VSDHEEEDGPSEISASAGESPFNIAISKRMTSIATLMLA